MRVWAVPAVICLGLVLAACLQSRAGPWNLDFAMFWNAARLGAGAYSAALPFPYPPPFLLIVSPLGWLPYPLAFSAWVFGTGALYVWASRSPLIALGNPTAAYNGLVGQNGFLFSAAILGGLQARPILGGAMLGLLAMKPHLGVAVGVALIAGAEWKRIGAAVASALTLSLLSLLAFGLDAWSGFFAATGYFQQMFASETWPWTSLASVYALARWAGLPFALGLHIAAAAVALVAVWFAWKSDSEGKIPVTAAASLLVSPYLFAYDAVLLVAPIAWLWERDRKWSVAVAVLAALPLLWVVTGIAGPNTIALASVLAIFASVLSNPVETDFRSAHIVSI